jgi:hypothetical protein
MSIKTILWASDGSEESLDALRWVAVSGNSRYFSVFARGIDGRLLRLSAPHELSTFLPYTSDTRRKQ